MGKLTGLLLHDMFGNAPHARVGEKLFYDLDDLNYKRFQALAAANPALNEVLRGALIIERASETLCLVPADLVLEALERLDGQNP